MGNLWSWKNQQPWVKMLYAVAGLKDVTEPTRLYVFCLHLAQKSIVGSKLRPMDGGGPPTIPRVVNSHYPHLRPPSPPEPPWHVVSRSSSSIYALCATMFYTKSISCCYLLLPHTQISSVQENYGYLQFWDLYQNATPFHIVRKQREKPSSRSVIYGSTFLSRSIFLRT